MGLFDSDYGVIGAPNYTERSISLPHPVRVASFMSKCARARAHTLARTEQCVSFADYLLIWLFKLVYLRYEASRYYSIAMCEYLYGKR